MNGYSVKTKNELESVLHSAMLEAIVERDRSKTFFSEESLRYIIMKHLSDYKFFGRFPNSLIGRKRLVFEFPYKRLKTRGSTYRPDISSVLLKKGGDNEIEEYLLAVELKIKNDVDDIKKCRNYVSEKLGRSVFNLAICVVLPPKGSNGPWDKINNKEITTRVKSRILLCTTENDKTMGERPVFEWLV